MLTNLNNSLILLFLHRFDFNHIRQNNCQNTANQYLCQERYWPFYTSLYDRYDIIDMNFTEDCHFSIFWLVSTAFLIFMGKWHWFVLWPIPRLPHDFHRMSTSTHISNLGFFVFFYIGASFTTFLWFGIDSELDLFLWLIHRRLSHDFLGFLTVTRTLEP